MLNDNNKKIDSSITSQTSQDIDKKNDSLDFKTVIKEKLYIKKNKKYTSLVNQYELLNIEKLKISKENKKEIIKIRNNLQKKTKDVYKFFLHKYFLLILPILDSIESSLSALTDIHEEVFLEVSIHLKKLNKLFLSIFMDFNVTKIDSINIPFNPEIHQAMSIDFSGKYLNNYISHVIQKGYLLNKRLLRPALVSVSQSEV
ncbi:nucleotide exchange factor GrpE [Buchnera aphidicola]|uniref:nucleotide exchange factor GrpE n=1 Tax=Buchnera aphidicola TaxID=9 RepID=UPI00094D2B63|nr:nucleotide exchange factor GrpE [Buchnera aphidicola]